MKEKIFTIIITIIIMLIRWLITCGIVKLITLCFGWNFSWLVATGIWLVTLLF